MRTTTQEMPISPDELRAQVRKIVASAGFSRAARMQRFLQFVVAGVLAEGGDSGDLKETLIGISVFDREASYDPKSDPVVRVEARRLRAKLAEYYEGPGLDDAVYIEIPKGSYIPVWRRQTKGEATILPVRSTRLRNRWLLAIAALAILCVIGVMIWQKRAPAITSSSAAGKIGSVAVLPFRNLSANSSQEYICAGLTDEITTDLAKIQTLKVISRTSADRYRATSKSLPEIARELKVDAVVEGTFASDSNRVRVSAQLIRAATDTHIWADSYDRNGDDLFDIQTEIATSVAREIGATLSPISLTADNKVTNAEAYDLYLRGRFLFNQRTPGGIEKSIFYFNRAIQSDPRFAKAYVALGESYILTNTYAGPAPGENAIRARKAAEKALALDPSLGEAHTVLAAVKIGYDRDWRGATAEYQQAIRLSPNYPTAHHWYSIHLARVGRHQEAAREIEKALELDPLSRIINTDAGETLYWARKPDRAVAALQRTFELDPNFSQMHIVMGKVREQKGEYQAALAEFKRASELAPDPPTNLAFTGHALAMAGKRAEALAIANQMEELDKRQYVQSILFAFLYCALGDHDRAMARLEKSYLSPGEGIGFIAVEPLFDGCRSDPRFQALVQRLHLTQTPASFPPATASTAK